MAETKEQLEIKEKFWGIQVARLTIVSILAGAIFGFVEYRDHKQDIAVEKSLDVISRFSDEPLLDDKIKTDRAWDDVNAGLTALFAVDKSAEAYEAFVIGFVESRSLMDSVYRILDLYEEAAICVQTKICDKKVVDQYLLDSGRDFFAAFYPVVCNQRTRWRDYSIYSVVQNYYAPQTVKTTCPGPSRRPAA